MDNYNFKSNDQILRDLKKNEALLNTEEQRDDCLIIKPVNRWMDEAKNRPIPNMLCSELCYENELCILFADTNLGKSIFAVQIADSISRGEAIEGFKLESKPKNVLYLDFELSDKQFEKRYSNNYQEHYRFHPNFYRAELNPETDLPTKFKNFEEYLCDSITESVLTNNIEAIIIDNLTYLGNDNEKAKDALVLMKFLKKLTKSYNVSILVLAHTPKRDESKPICKNDLSGSKMLMNFCDSAFAIGRSTVAHNFRYIKQIKQRNTEHVYHTENVIVCKIEQKYNFLGFEFLDYDTEYSHLKSYKTNDLEDRDAEMIGYIKEGKSNVEIGKLLGISEGAIRKRKKALNL